MRVSVRIFHVRKTLTCSRSLCAWNWKFEKTASLSNHMMPFELCRKEDTERFGQRRAANCALRFRSSRSSRLHHSGPHAHHAFHGLFHERYMRRSGKALAIMQTLTRHDHHEICIPACVCALKRLLVWERTKTDTQTDKKPSIQGCESTPIDQACPWPA